VSRLNPESGWTVQNVADRAAHQAGKQITRATPVPVTGRLAGNAARRERALTRLHPLTMRRDDLEKVILDGLEHRLMEPALTKIFCEEYARAMNRMHAEHNAQRSVDAEALSKAERDLARLVQALLDGVPGSVVRQKMAELEVRRDALRHRLTSSQDLSVPFPPQYGRVLPDAGRRPPRRPDGRWTPKRGR
jgi:hypothetical protein